MIVAIDPDDPTPVYAQIHGQILRMALSGALPAGTRLPPIRQLASDLGVARGTVVRAYELLVSDGWAVASGRRGTLITGRRSPSAVDRAEVDAELERAAARFVRTVGQLGVGPAEALARVRALLADGPSAVAEVDEADARVVSGVDRPSDHGSMGRGRPGHERA